MNHQRASHEDRDKQSSVVGPRLGIYLSITSERPMMTSYLWNRNTCACVGKFYLWQLQFSNVVQCWILLLGTVPEIVIQLSHWESAHTLISLQCFGDFWTVSFGVEIGICCSSGMEREVCWVFLKLMTGFLLQASNSAKSLLNPEVCIPSSSKGYKMKRVSIFYII